MKLPYRLNWKLEAPAILIMLVAVCSSYYFYLHFPDHVPTHWNFAGEVDGWSGRGFAAFFFPLLIAGIYALMLLLPLVDPLRSRYQEFSRGYQVIRVSLVIFMTVIYFITSLVGLGYQISINKVMPVGVGLLFIILGNFLPKIKKNWFVGIRTPWTLSNEEVWNKTHRLGGKIFIIAGLLFMSALWLSERYYLWVFAIIMIGIVAGSFGYSWWLWKKLKNSPTDQTDKTAV